MRVFLLTGSALFNMKRFFLNFVRSSLLILDVSLFTTAVTLLAHIDSVQTSPLQRSAPAVLLMPGLGADNLGGLSLVGATGLVGVTGLATLKRRRQAAVRRDRFVQRCFRDRHQIRLKKLQ